jgi:hypothetical protein
VNQDFEAGRKMNRIRTLITLCLFFASCQLIDLMPCQADDDSRRPENTQSSQQRLEEIRRAATEKRREWLRKHLTAELRDRNQIVQLNAQLDRLDDQQVDVAAVRLLEQLEKRSSRDAAHRAVQNLARAREVRGALRRRVAARRASPAGFYPVITVLPAGASLTASAVVSADRRHVRITLNPFFSSIGPVDTFNFLTGETRRPLKLNPQLRQPTPVIPRYDGLRTRSDRSPRTRNGRSPRR